MSVATRPRTALLPLLAEKAAGLASGVLTASRGKHKRLFCMKRGRLVLAASNVIEEQPEQALVERGLLGPDELPTAREQAKQAGLKLTNYLVQNGNVSTDQLQLALRRRVFWLLESTLDWQGGEYRFDPGQPNLAGEALVDVPCAMAVLDHLLGHTGRPEVLRSKLGPADARPTMLPRHVRVLEGADLSPLMTFLLEHCDGSRDVAALLNGSPASSAETLALLYGFKLLGILEARSAAVAAPSEIVVTRDECLMRIQTAEGTDHYAVLGLDAKATESAVRTAYYDLARRFHPDRFRSGELQDLVESMETYFSRVTEAYNTLIDAQRREEYDRHLREKASGRADSPEKDAAYLARQNFARAKVLLDKRRRQDALKFLENAVQLDDAQPAYRLELGRLLALNPRRRQEAQEHLLAALRLDPSLAAGYVALGQLCRKTDRDAEAVERFREALRWEPANAEAQAALAELGATKDGGILRGLFRS